MPKAEWIESPPLSALFSFPSLLFFVGLHVDRNVIRTTNPYDPVIITTIGISTGHRNVSITDDLIFDHDCLGLRLPFAVIVTEELFNFGVDLSLLLWSD